MEYKIFSKVHPDYFFLVVKSGENLLIDTNLLQKTLTNKDKKKVIYCGFVACERSHVGAVLAKEAGYKNVYRFPGGIAAWLDAGNSIDK